ncbi:protein of unknown function DUF88 [Desulfarculus baarsii DSM 2075]|uniref:HTH OST-type domain-containing protein n=1 Tax=Desulfarculus baarsii (strain ATCC 33931 / DSM 2075 / LMG 7858 / VKM B-1802 / 2st14) TaxID=644282 RepID=E1QEB9_DESB2|nr:NYN domain-containing protein [Desulfarculus baarsii]ADK83905.1 protein of unknown function DUF88 [Desulfarculus baarsii DSM 2075]
MKNIAVYWDFENIHSSLCNLRYGEDWLDQFRGQRHPAVVDIGAIMQFAESQGSVNINKAYGNWAWYQQYSHDLHEFTFDLVQLFPRGMNMKNGADIRLAIDALDDLNRHEHLSVFIIVGGDSDYISLAQRVRQRGKEIIGIGVRETTNKFWINACNDFRFYSSIAALGAEGGSSAPPPQATGDIEEAKRLLRQAVFELQKHHGGEAVRMAHVRPMLTNLDPYFDLADYGCRSFDEFISRCADCVITSQAGQETHVKLIDQAPPAQVKPADISANVDLYRKILDEKDMPLPRPGLLKPGLLHVIELFVNQPEGLDYLNDVDKSLSEHFLQMNLSHATTDCFNIRQLIYRIRGFYIDKEANKRFLHYKNEDFRSLWEQIAHRLLDAIHEAIDGELDFAALSLLIQGDDSLADELAGLAQAAGQYRPKTPPAPFQAATVVE